MKDEMGGVVIKEFVDLMSKMYLFLVDDSSGHKKANGVNKSIVVTKSHAEYRGILLNNKWLRHSLNKSQCKNHKEPTQSTKILYYAL